MNIEEFLSELAHSLEEEKNLSAKYIKSSSSYNGFEHLVEKILKIVCQRHPEVNYTFHFGHHFPDITLTINSKNYGLELKSRINGSWDNNGGSVFESISDDDYEEIYLMFGSLQSKENPYYQVRFNTYWQVVDSIKVTHKPRYHINMNPKHTLFKNKDEYFAIRSFNEQQKNQFVQQKLKEQATSPQWYLSNNDSEEVAPTPWNELGKEKNTILSEMLILFAHDLLYSKRANYNAPCQYLMTQYFCYYPSFRDIFSAGGSKIINNTEVPAMVYTFYKQKENILTILNNPSTDFKEQAYKIWNQHYEIPSNLNFKDQFCILLDKIGNQTTNKRLSAPLKEDGLTLSQLILSN